MAMVGRINALKMLVLFRSGVNGSLRGGVTVLNKNRTTRQDSVHRPNFLDFLQVKSIL